MTSAMSIQIHSVARAALSSSYLSSQFLETKESFFGLIKNYVLQIIKTRKAILNKERWAALTSYWRGNYNIVKKIYVNYHD